jgi:hypothetical protein
MGYLAIAVGIGALWAFLTRRDRAPTPEEDEGARTIGRAMSEMPLVASLGAVGPPEMVPSPLASAYEPDGDKVVRVESTSGG